MSEADLPPSHLWRNGGKVTSHTHSHTVSDAQTLREMRGERGGWERSCEERKRDPEYV